MLTTTHCRSCGRPCHLHPTGRGRVCRTRLAAAPSLPGVSLCSGQVAACSCAECCRDRFEAVTADLYRDFEARLDAEAA
jgi:hypothetical protein